MTMETAALVVAVGECILLVRSRGKEVYYLPGGKLEEGESLTAALLREVEEELSVVFDSASLRYLVEIEAEAYGEAPAARFRMHCFAAAGPADVVPATEIEEIQFFSEDEYAQQPVTAPAVFALFDWLRLHDAFSLCQRVDFVRR